MHHAANFFGENFLSILFLTGIILYGFASIRRVLKQRDPVQEEPEAEPVTNELVYPGNQLGLADDEIEHILLRFHAYYSGITEELRTRFKERLKEFIQHKTFVIYGKEGYKEMPVLISAAAIQVSFGLDNFLLPWFKFIRIHMEQYFDDDTLKAVNGGVEGDSIIVAWNQIVTGNNDPNDGENVGIHEMAHALYYQNVVVEKKERDFKELFNQVLEQGKIIFEQRNTQPSFFNDYAYKNLQEFWAESVEMFFERPGIMQVAYSDLFTTLKGLLRQDPLNKSNPLPGKDSF